jgi:hypothetical protein
MFMCYIIDCGQLERGVPCKSHPVLTLMPWDSDSYATVRYLALKLSPGPSISESQICHFVSPQRTKLKELSNHAPKPLHHSRRRPNRLSHHRTPDQHDLLRETEIHHRPHPEPLLPKIRRLQKLGAKIVEHKPERVREMAQTLKQTGADAICIIPPANHSKMDITKELVEASKQANILNVCLISSAGCDLADEKRQPKLREFIEIEQMVMSTKGDPETETGHSPVVIR